MSRFKSSQPETKARAYRSSVADIPHRGRSSAAASLIPGSENLGATHEDGKKVADPEFRAAVADSLRKFGLNCTLVFIYFRFSFLHEFLGSRYGVDFHTLLILGVLSGLAVLGSGRPFIALKYKSGRMWLFFAASMCIATVFSSWRGGSLNVLTPYLRTAFPLLLFIPATVFTAEDIQKVLSTIGIAGATAILLGFNSDFRTGRLGLDIGGTISDPNDFAAHLILVAPAVAYLTMQQGRGLFMKLLGAGLLAAGFFEFLATGSRGGLIALICMSLYILKKGSTKVRMALVFGIPILCAFALPLIPGDSAQRLVSLFDSSKAPENAADSREARISLLKESLRITFHHPLLGVGPGEFEDYQGGLAAERGERGMWHATHNSYTQASSECGIPAAVFYIAAMFITYRSLRKAKNEQVVPVSSVASTLSIMIVGYGSAMFFLSHAYTFALLVITGASISIERFLMNRHDPVKSATPMLTAPLAPSP